MSNKTNPRERVMAKDAQNIMGYKSCKAFSLLRQIKLAKMAAATQFKHKAVVSFVSVDDFAQYTGLSREAVKAGLVD
ncbi:hypothetical protein GO755_33580 [Spirosoma sp. HMF4905]|uniref:Uncharacterized protein n=1 Tax=Spirosoma arboris TaxID=2682092 RepID=A0A7K1SMK0_9BACT|nr:hypothetical protein [Spirosoma arboris]MVM35008.1 hypothetical protein [Spirosoma arboris]